MELLLVFLGLLATALSQAPPSLKDALDSAGASGFATFLQSDPDLWGLYTSGQVGTVFAPADATVKNPPSSLARRAASPRQQELAGYQAAQSENKFGDIRRGGPIRTLNKASRLGNQGQRIVPSPRSSSNSGNSSSRRSLLPRADNYTSLLPIASGLGDLANIIKSDIAYDGGVIHLTDNYFTLPQSLSSTSKAGGHTAFADLAAKGNLTDTLDNTSFVTVFVPSNAAFAASNASSSSRPADLISNHVITNFLGYLPELSDGQTLTSKTGNSIAVSVHDGNYYVNGARITQANLILENGVAHVIDKVLSTSYPPPPVPAAAAGLYDKASLACTMGGAAIMAFLALF